MKNVLKNPYYIETRTLEDKIDRTESTLVLAAKWIAQLELKTDDLENRGRIFGHSASKRELKADAPYWTLYTICFLSGWNLDPRNPSPWRECTACLAPENPNQNRAVLLHFLKFQDKEFVLHSLRQLDIIHNRSKLFFAQDLSAETIRLRHEFISMGTFHGFHHHPCKLRVLHNGKIKLLHKAEEFYIMDDQI